MKYIFDLFKGIRLAGGMGPYEGTVQLNINGVWGSICGNSFDINDAHVICKMAGYPRYNIYILK